MRSPEQGPGKSDHLLRKATAGLLAFSALVGVGACGSSNNAEGLTSTTTATATTNETSATGKSSTPESEASKTSQTPTNKPTSEKSRASFTVEPRPDLNELNKDRIKWPQNLAEQVASIEALGDDTKAQQDAIISLVEESLDKDFDTDLTPEMTEGVDEEQLGPEVHKKIATRTALLLFAIGESGLETNESIKDTCKKLHELAIGATVDSYHYPDTVKKIKWLSTFEDIDKDSKVKKAGIDTLTPTDYKGYDSLIIERSTNYTNIPDVTGFVGHEIIGLRELRDEMTFRENVARKKDSSFKYVNKDIGPAVRYNMFTRMPYKEEAGDDTSIIGGSEIKFTIVVEGECPKIVFADFSHELEEIKEAGKITQDGN